MNNGGDLIITYDGIEILSKPSETCARTFSSVLPVLAMYSISNKRLFSPQSPATRNFLPFNFLFLHISMISVVVLVMLDLGGD